MRLPVKAGPRVVSVAFVGRFTEPEDAVMHLGGSSRRLLLYDETRAQALDSVSISGPYDASDRGEDTPSLRKVLTCQPRTAAQEEPCARTILSTLARQAYRRPVSAAEVQTLMAFYRDGRRDGDFKTGVQVALSRILTSPNFLFRVEQDPPHAVPGKAYRISDLELASRLSFFLWSSIPDKTLLDLAAQGRLHQPAVLDGQVKRMIADPRSGALVDNFVGQWLLLRNIRDVSPDQQLFPDFDEELRSAMEQETTLFINDQIHRNRSVVELLSARYTFLNERLAQHYGIPGVVRPADPAGDAARQPARRVSGPRQHAEVTSYPNRTSLVHARQVDSGDAVWAPRRLRRRPMFRTSPPERGRRAAPRSACG